MTEEVSQRKITNTFSIAPEVARAFADFCDKKGISRSGAIELIMATICGLHPELTAEPEQSVLEVLKEETDKVLA